MISTALQTIEISAKRSVVWLSLVALLIAVAPAKAQDLPEGNSGVDQYIERVPDAGGGSKAPQRRPSGGSNGGSAPASPGGSEAPLDQIVGGAGAGGSSAGDDREKSNSDRKERKKKAGGVAEGDKAQASEADPAQRALSARPVSEADGGGAGSLVIVLVLLVLSPILGYALWRVRRREQS